MFSICRPLTKTLVHISWWDLILANSATSQGLLNIIPPNHLSGKTDLLKAGRTTSDHKHIKTNSLIRLMVKVRFGEIYQSTFCISADFVNPALTRGRRAGISLMSLMALTENEEEEIQKSLTQKIWKVSSGGLVGKRKEAREWEWCDRRLSIQQSACHGHVMIMHHIEWVF